MIEEKFVRVPVFASSGVPVRVSATDIVSVFQDPSVLNKTFILYKGGLYLSLIHNPEAPVEEPEEAVSSIFRRAFEDAVEEANKKGWNSIDEVICAESITAADFGMLIPPAGGGGISDLTLKENVTVVSSVSNGLNLYTWDWNEKAKEIYNMTGRAFGFVAQEVEAVAPQFVFRNNTGHLCVRYKELMKSLNPIGHGK